MHRPKRNVSPIRKPCQFQLAPVSPVTCHETGVTARDASIYPDAGLRTSYNNRLPATAAFKKSRLSCMGMRTS
jgi:hypothetical protein